MRFTKFCWLGKHMHMITKPTNSSTQGRPSPKKCFRGLRLVLCREQTIRSLTRPNSRQTNTLLRTICIRRSTGPTHETCAAADHAEYTATARQHELDNADREYIGPEIIRWESMICLIYFFFLFHTFFSSSFIAHYW